MQAEHPRPGGFIISPHRQSVPIIKPATIQKQSRHRSFSTTSFVNNFVSFCHSFGKIIIHNFTKKALSVSVFICCIWVFFIFFTFGTGIYYNGRQIAVTANEKDCAKAINSVNATIASHNAKSVTSYFKIFPVLTLRNNISNFRDTCDSLLLCSPDLVRGCTVYSDNIPVFTAKNRNIAEAVVQKHISETSASQNARITTNLTYGTNIVPKNEISDSEKCFALLSGNENVNIVSVVNETDTLSIPFDTQTMQDPDLYIGESVTVTEGKAGMQQVRSEATYKNGAKQSEIILSRQVISQPVSRIIRTGIKPKDILVTGVFYPLEGVISSPYGKRWGRMHEGIDIAVAEGTPVIAAEGGKVTYAGELGGYGNFIKIDHGNGIETAYAHLSTIQVTTGQIVSANTQIALSGNTGRSTGPHLHFEIVKDSVPLNPDLYLKKRS